MRKKILIIDDDQTILDAFDAMLSSFSYQVVVSPNADCLQTLSKDTLPDLILLDILLSGQDGRVFCKELKSKTETKHIPIIMMSAHQSSSQSITDIGADDFLSKPFEMDDLLAKVKKHVR